MRRIIYKILPLLAALILASCEITKSLWEDVYEEQYKQFLVSVDGRSIVFLSDKYHDIFFDESGAIAELLDLDNKHVVTIDQEKTKFAVEMDDISGEIIFKTFDLDLSADRLNELKSLAFNYDKKDRDLTLKIFLKGKRYLAGSDMNYYTSLLNEKYTIKIVRHSTPSFTKKVERIALTPLALTADAIVFIGEMIYIPLE